MTESRDPVSPPIALTIAGSDSGGGAGIQADIKTMTAHGAFATSVVTATTAQHTHGVTDIVAVPADHVGRQYEAVIEDFDVAAVKTGLLATAEIVETVADRLSSFDGETVVDPVMIAAAGDRLLSREAEDAYGRLIRHATLVTPNADEAAVLTGRDVEDADAASAAAVDLVEMGADAALVKGGHLDTAGIVDTLVLTAESSPSCSDLESIRVESPRIATDATHGSGCVLSSAIAARLARGEALTPAVEHATRELTGAVQRGYDVGHGPGAVNPTQLDR